MNLWAIDKFTGRYPPLHVAWNLLWLIPLYISGFLFVAFVFCQSGPRRARQAWEAIL